MPPSAVIPILGIAEQRIAETQQTVRIYIRRSTFIVVVGIGDRERDLILVKHRRAYDIGPHAKQ